MNYYPRQERLTHELCEEIDELKQAVSYWKEKYEQLNKDYFELSDNYQKSNMETIGSLFQLTFRIKDTPEGLLITNPVTE